MSLTLAVIAAFGSEFLEETEAIAVTALLDGLSTVSVDSLHSTLKAVTRPLDTKHKKVAFQDNEKSTVKLIYGYLVTLKMTHTDIWKHCWICCRILYSFYSRSRRLHYSTVQLNLNFTHTCRHTRVLARLTFVKLQKLACALTVASNFGVCTRASEHTRHTTNVCYELALGLPHYTYGVTTGTVAVDNEMQLFCS